MVKTLSERSNNILHAVVSEYILTGVAVGSRTISKKYSIDLSPASIRNVMADLEELGLLYQPHTSAGRIPTDDGLRYYVDRILEIRKLTKEEKETIDSRYKLSSFEIIDIMEETSRLLSMFSRYAGVILAPKFENTIFERMELIKLRENQILTVFVSKTGMIQNRIITIEEDLSQDDLYQFARYLNEILGNLTLEEAQKKITDETNKEKNMYDWILSRALILSQKAFNAEIEDGLFIDGKYNILECREFCDVEKMKSIFRAFEEKSILVKLLDQAMESEGIQIFIGTENEFQEMHDCSVVASPYTWRDSTIGTLGVIGPIRMNYCDIVPIVDYTAKTVSRIMDARY